MSSFFLREKIYTHFYKGCYQKENFNGHRVSVRHILQQAFLVQKFDTIYFVMFGELVGGAGCVGGHGKKSGWGVFWTTSELAFGINADQWTTTAQDEGEYRKTARNKGRNVSW